MELFFGFMELIGYWTAIYVLSGTWVIAQANRLRDWAEEVIRNG